VRRYNINEWLAFHHVAKLPAQHLATVARNMSREQGVTGYKEHME
jgi:hypothetical protein